MEDIGKVVAGFVGGIAADEGVRLITGRKPPSSISQFAKTVSATTHEPGGGPVRHLDRRLLHVGETPSGTAIAVYAFEKGDGDPDGLMTVIPIGDGRLHVEISRSSYATVVFKRNGKELVRFEELSAGAKAGKASGYFTTVVGK